MASSPDGGRYKRIPTDESTALEVEDLDEDLDGEDFQPHEHNQESYFKFVESSWFQACSACVITFNTVTVFLEADNAHWKETLFWPDQTTLCFYILELFCRISFFGKYFLCGPRWLLFWNVLDISVVSAGVLDQWVLPFMPIDKESPLRSLILLFRMLRLVRVMKIIRVFLETDLSWTEKPKFQSFIGGVIGFNALLMGFETDIKWTGWFYIEQVLLVIYVFELLVRLKRFGLFFLSCHNPDITWNFLDFCIVVSSAADSWVFPAVNVLGKQFTNAENTKKHEAGGMKLSQVMMLMRMLRLMRILRLVKLVKSVRPLYILVTGVLAAFQGVAWVLVLTVVTLYAAGILATRLIGHGLLFPPGVEIPESTKVFKSVPDSMFTLFRVMSGAESDEEAQAIDSLMTALPTAKFGFIFFLVTSSWTLLSILTAVVSDNMITTTGEQEREMKIASADEDREETRQELRTLFGEIECDGVVKEEDVQEFLKDKEAATKTARCCNVATRNVVQVLRTLSPDGTPVKLDDFVTCMLDVGKPVTEQSMMKIETLFKFQQRHTDEGCKSLSTKIDNFRNRIKGWHASRSGQETSQNDQSGDPASFDKSTMAAIGGLVDKQKKNSEGIAKLHESVQALLRSQEALRQQNIFNNSRKAKLEADLAALQQRNSHSFSELHDTIQALKSDLSRVGGAATSVPPRTGHNGHSSSAARTGDRLGMPVTLTSSAAAVSSSMPATASRLEDDESKGVMALRGGGMCGLNGPSANTAALRRR